MLEGNLNDIRRNIAKAAEVSGRRPQDIKLVAVSKTVDNQMVRRAFDLGIRDFGENRVKEFLRKKTALPEANWHMIGSLQTNKVKDIIGKTRLIHSLDSWKLALVLERQAQKSGLTVPVLVQLNIAEEKQKSGLAVDELAAFLGSAGELSHLQILGLMVMAPLVDKAEEARPVFRKMKEIREKYRNFVSNNVELKYLSMGMSQDYEIAIEEGADIIRLGSTLFH